jgi:archaellum component FlaF (FlaF/FlaG flagellin family)
MHKKRSHKAVSNIIAAIITIVILFTIIVPLLLYIQNANALYNFAVLERRNLDYYRSQEDLEVHAYEDLKDNNTIKVEAYNKGDISVIIKRIWVIDRKDVNTKGISGIYIFEYNKNCTPDLPYLLNPRQEVVTFNTNIKAIVGHVYDIKLVTERGNIYIPKESPLLGGHGGNPATYAYSLIVTIVNMHPGTTYNFTLVGNVPYSPYTLIHKATASTRDISMSFGVNAGEYILYLSDGKGWNIQQNILVPQTLAVVMDCENSTIISSLEVTISVQSRGKIKPNDIFKIQASIKNIGYETINVTAILQTNSSWNIIQGAEQYIEGLESMKETTIYWDVNATTPGTYDFWVIADGVKSNVVTVECREK